MRRFLLPALLLLAASACGDDRSGYSTSDRAATAPTDGAAREEAAQAPAAPGRGADVDAVGRARGTEQGALADTASGAAPAQPGADSAAPPQMIIRNGRAVVRVDSLEAAIARARQLARRLGGWVGNTSVQTGAEQVRTATVELKIPSARFDQALAGLEPLGKVEKVDVTAQDVGEEYVDVSARMANARRLEERLVGLLATRTGRLEDVLAVERELARVREQIERFEGRLRFLRTRVAVSTLNLDLHEPYPLTGDYPGQNRILGAFRDAWSNFVDFAAGFIASLGVLVPLGLILFGLFLLLRALLRRFGRKRPPAPPPSAPRGPSTSA